MSRFPKAVSIRTCERCALFSNHEGKKGEDAAYMLEEGEKKDQGRGIRQSFNSPLFMSSRSNGKATLIA